MRLGERKPSFHFPLGRALGKGLSFGIAGSKGNFVRGAQLCCCPVAEPVAEKVSCLL